MFASNVVWCLGVRDAILEIWQANNQGNYYPADTPAYQRINYDYTDINADPNGYNCRARVRSDQDGKFSFHTSKSSTVSIDGSQGGLITIFVELISLERINLVKKKQVIIVANTDHSFDKNRYKFASQKLPCNLVCKGNKWCIQNIPDGNIYYFGNIVPTTVQFFLKNESRGGSRSLHLPLGSTNRN